MQVLSICESYDGGPNAFGGYGEATWVIRFGDCSMSCLWCCGFNRLGEAIALGGKPQDLVDRLASHGTTKKVTIVDNVFARTDDGFAELVKQLEEHGFSTSIAVTGAYDLSLSRTPHSTHFVVDYKLPSSGEEAHMRTQIFRLRDGFDPAFDIVKMFIATEEDLARALQVVNLNVSNEMSPSLSPHRFWFVGASFDGTVAGLSVATIIARLRVASAEWGQWTRSINVVPQSRAVLE